MSKARKRRFSPGDSSPLGVVWTEPEDTLLEKYYAQRGADWCATRLPGRTARAVETRARRLKLFKPVVKVWNFSPRAEALYMAGLGPTAIAAVLDRPREQVEACLYYFGLPCVRAWVREQRAA